MADEHYTLILIPDARSAPRKIRVSRRLVRWAARASVGITLVGTFVLAHYGWLNRQVSRMDDLRSQNATLNEQAHRYRETLDQLEHRIVSLGDTVTRLGVISGVEDTMPEGDTVAAGMGGVAGL